MYLKEFHTIAQRSLFEQKLQNVTKVFPSVADLIYKLLTMNTATVDHSTTQERLHIIAFSFNEKGLLAYVRNCKAGRPTSIYDVFDESGVFEEVTAADDRRHNVSYLSQYISIVLHRNECQKEHRSAIGSS